MRTTCVILFGWIINMGIYGCGEDPVSYSDAIGINLKAKSGDAKEGVIRDEKGITTESGNPFSVFIREAEIKLGQAPGLVELSALSLTLGAKSTGTTALEEVFTGEVEIMFYFDESKNTLNVGRVTDPAGAGPVSFNHDFNFSQLGEADRKAFLSGSFKVVIRGASAVEFTSKKIEAELLTTLHFEAFE